MKKLTNIEFIKRSNEIHGNKYDYSLVKYINNSSKIKIICPIHGVFEQIPNNHIHKKYGCSKCIGNNKLTTDDFIKRSNEIHGDKYDYSLVKYKSIIDRVKIYCDIHGIFEQTPSHHLRGQGCPLCSNTQKLTTEEFIKRSKEIHGNKYDYSLVEYKSIKDYVKIICPIHGIFEQSSEYHLNGNICKKCSKVLKIESIRTKSYNFFIYNSNNIHNNKYDYSLVNYINNSTKVKIICPIHGVFEQRPSSHINLKSGCPKCNISKGETEIKKLLEKNNIKFEVQKKFDDCKFKQKLSFDFYLLDYNTCIEFDGEQHFSKFRFEKDDSILKTRQLRDNIKTNYCISNNINLLRIRYNENIPDKILEFLNKRYLMV